MMRLFSIFSALLIATLVVTVTVRAANADDRWTVHDHMVKSRLIASGADDGGAPIYAWEAEMAPGWKTYWRSPGEAGLPVVVSTEAGQADILFPLPERFTFYGIETFGYGGRVVLPFRSDAAPGSAVSVSFMVCDVVCIPFELSQPLPQNPDDLSAIRVDAAMKKVPDRSGEGGLGLAVDAIKVTGQPGRQRVIIDARATAPFEVPDLLIEAGPGVHFGAPRIRLLQDGRRARFVLPAATTDDAADLRGQRARLTLSASKHHAIDRIVTLGGQPE